MWVTGLEESKKTIQLLGILNLTSDSFSDGGRFLDPDVAIRHGLAMVAAGADFVDVGAQSTHPDAAAVPDDVQVARLTPVVRALSDQGVKVSVDAHSPAVIEAVLEMGVEMINDVRALADPRSAKAVASSAATAVLMHSIPPAARAHCTIENIVPRIIDYFEHRLAELERVGLRRDSLVLDPGLGLFLGPDPQVSLHVLSHLGVLRRFGCPLLVGPSRKSFLGTILGGPSAPRPPSERSAGTLAAELYALEHGATFVRTHDPGALRDALRVREALRQAGRRPSGWKPRKRPPEPPTICGGCVLQT